ncbi:MAG: hypothetical protein EBR59_09800 [Methylococcaceae bacterium]|nr:hypothetical protein [Methylococcaceae bacterium]
MEIVVLVDLKLAPLIEYFPPVMVSGVAVLIPVIVILLDVISVLGKVEFCWEKVNGSGDVSLIIFAACKGIEKETIPTQNKNPTSLLNMKLLREQGAEIISS